LRHNQYSAAAFEDGKAATFQVVVVARSDGGPAHPLPLCQNSILHNFAIDCEAHQKQSMKSYYI